MSEEGVTVRRKVSRAAKRVLASDSQLMVDDNNNTYVCPSILHASK